MTRSVLIWAGGIALLAAMAIDTLAVLGRNFGMPLVGSIELVQAAVLVSGILAIVMATWERSHARVKLISSRLTGWPRQIILRFGRLADVLFFALFAAGSIWLAADLWFGHEQSELLGVPWKALRLVANAGLLACLAIALVRLVGKAER